MKSERVSQLQINQYGERITDRNIEAEFDKLSHTMGVKYGSTVYEKLANLISHITKTLTNPEYRKAQSHW